MKTIFYTGATRPLAFARFVLTLAAFSFFGGAELVAQVQVWVPDQTTWGIVVPETTTTVWVPPAIETHHVDAVTHVVHHDAQTVTVTHPAVTHVVHHDAVTHS